MLVFLLAFILVSFANSLFIGKLHVPFTSKKTPYGKDFVGRFDPKIQEAMKKLDLSQMDTFFDYSDWFLNENLPKEEKDLIWKIQDGLHKDKIGDLSEFFPPLKEEDTKSNLAKVKNQLFKTESKYKIVNLIIPTLNQIYSFAYYPNLFSRLTFLIFGQVCNYVLFLKDTTFKESLRVYMLFFGLLLSGLTSISKHGIKFDADIFSTLLSLLIVTVSTAIPSLITFVSLFFLPQPMFFLKHIKISLAIGIFFGSLICPNFSVTKPDSNLALSFKNLFKEKSSDDIELEEDMKKLDNDSDEDGEMSVYLFPLKGIITEEDLTDAERNDPNPIIIRKRSTTESRKLEENLTPEELKIMNQPPPLRLYPSPEELIATFPTGPWGFRDEIGEEHLLDEEEEAKDRDPLERIRKMPIYRRNYRFVDPHIKLQLYDTLEYGSNVIDNMVEKSLQDSKRKEIEKWLESQNGGQN